MTVPGQDSVSPAAGVLYLDAVVIGAGFGGMYTVYKLRQVGFSVRGFERGTDFGGTWYWNRYPGARCDIESLSYQYAFEPELARNWEWTERYAQQPEIERYVQYAAAQLDLRKDFEFSTSVIAAVFDEAAHRWRVETDRGQILFAQFVVAATGCLSTQNVPDLPGLNSFTGEAYHTGAWPKDGVDLTGKRVGVIGTGSSGVQSIPKIAEVASQLYVFQRTAQFSVPAGQSVLDPEKQRRRREDIIEWREQAMMSFGGLPEMVFPERSALEDSDEELRRKYDERWGIGGALDFLTVHNDVLFNEDANARVSEYVRSKIREIVKDPKTAELLCPTIPIGVKRFLVDTNYFETYNRENVGLVDIHERPIERITPKGIVTGGREYELDVIVFATGFDAMTGPLLQIDIRGRNGLSLREAWQAGPRTLLGLEVAGFPNLLMVSGPLSPSVLAVMTIGIEQQVDWIADCLLYMRSQGLDSIEANATAQDEWVEHTQDFVRGTMRMRVDSWYVGANIPGKPRVFMVYTGGLGTYKGHCDEAAAHGYAGFEFSRAGHLASPPLGLSSESVR